MVNAPAFRTAGELYDDLRQLESELLNETESG